MTREELIEALVEAKLRPHNFVRTDKKAYSILKRVHEESGLSKRVKSNVGTSKAARWAHLDATHKIYRKSNRDVKLHNLYRQAAQKSMRRADRALSGLPVGKKKRITGY